MSQPNSVPYLPAADVLSALLHGRVAEEGHRAPLAHPQLAIAIALSDRVRGHIFGVQRWGHVVRGADAVATRALKHDLILEVKVKVIFGGRVDDGGVRFAVPSAVFEVGDEEFVVGAFLGGKIFDW